MSNPKPCVLWLLVGCVAGAYAQAPQLTNAAQTRYGARFGLTLAPGGGKDKGTPVESSFDGNPHTRLVVWGEPYTLTIELLDRLPLVKVGFELDDYAAEQAPRDIEVRLDGGPPVAVSLALTRPQRNKPAWQEFPLTGEAKVVTITVKSNHPGTATFGGLGEVALWTTADLDTRLKVPGYDPASPVDLRPPAQEADAQPAKVTLPPRAQAGQHPSLLLTPSEVTELRQQLTQPRGQAARKVLLDLADGMLAGELAFPDPKGPPGQLNDRGDDVAKVHAKLANSCGTLGMAYVVTGDKRYAARAREILLGYAQRYVDYPDHKGANPNDTGKVMGQRLSEAMWVIPLLLGWDDIHDSSVLSADDHKLIADKLVRPCITFIRRAEPTAEAADRTRAQADWRTADPPTVKGFVPNWVQFYNAATLFAGVLTDERDWVDLAVAETRRNLHNGITADGMWNEGAIGYQMFVMQAFTLILEGAARQGIDLWSFDSARYKRLFDSPLRYVYPDGTGPGINDSGRSTLGDWSTMVYDYAWLRYGDPRHAGMVNHSPRQLQASEAVYFPTRVYREVPEPAVVSFPSTVLSSVGYAILRDGPGAKVPRYALIDYGPHGGVHGHWDKLNLELFWGDELGGEPVFHRYEDPLHDQWTKQTVAHNTVTVNQRPQADCEGRVTAFWDDGDLKLMRCETADAYPGVVLDRTVVFTPDAIVDLYRARGSRDLTFDRTLRFHGALEGQTTGGTQKLGDDGGYQHLLLQSKRDLTAGGVFAWTAKVGRLNVTVAPAAGQQALVCRGPDQDDLVLLRQTTARADFVMGYRLDGAPVKLEAIATGDPDVVAWRVGGVNIVVSHRAGSWTAAGKTSEARAAVWRTP